MNLHRFILSTLLAVVALTTTTMAAPRIWKNKEGTRSFRGEFVQRDKENVTIMMTSNFKKVQVSHDKLHADDLKWLKSNHPLPGEIPSSNGNANPVARGAVYDTIALGDNRKVVMKKLMDCKMVKNSLPQALFDRTGLNGVFHTVKGHEFHGMQASIYYGWDDSNNLKELSFHGESHPQTAIDTVILPTWKSLAENITAAYGKPKSADTTLNTADLNDGAITFTHVWSLKEGGSLLLGAGRSEDSYMVIARFTATEH